MKLDYKKILPHLAALLLFLVLTAVYFAPVVFGDKALPQGDMISANGASNEVMQYHKQTGDYSMWTNCMFSGMPTTSYYGEPTFNIFAKIQHGLTFGLDYLSAGMLIFYLIGFYIMMLCFGMNVWMAILGSIALSFVSYNFVIIEAGHVTKGYAIAMIGVVLGGVSLAFRKKYVIGALMTLLGLGVQIACSHVQITYYTMLATVMIGLSYAVYAIIHKEIPQFFKSFGALLIAALMAILPNTSSLFPMYEYGKDTMRGGNILETPVAEGKESTGLDINYAYSWSYGQMESFTLLIPNLYGGSSHEKLGDNSETYRVLERSGNDAKAFCKAVPTYWGEQPFTSGTVYAGALICFLFVLGLFVVKGPEKWWILAAGIFALILSWGRHFMGLNEFFFHYLPLYNKFRTPSMALVIVNVVMPLLGLLALKKILESKDPKAYRKSLLKSLYITGGLCLFFVLFGSTILSFSSEQDANMKLPEWLLEAIRSDRASMMRRDALRSLLLVGLGFGLLWFFIQNKIKGTVLVATLAVITLVDLWSVDQRYLHNDKFQARKTALAIQPTEADLMILEDRDPSYRVLNAATNTFNDAHTSYFHKSVGGYSPAKLRRYQDIIDYHFSRGMNPKVLNMLNTRYFIVPDQQGIPSVQRNVAALGNAWFVKDVKWVDSPNQEIEALYDVDPADTAIVHKEFASFLQNKTIARDDSASIQLLEYRPNYLKYKSKANTEQLAVFSEVYYPSEWDAYVDGKLIPHFRTNYILRAAFIPAGDHTVEFKHSPKMFRKYAQITRISSFACIAGLLLLAGIKLYQRKKKQDN